MDPATIAALTQLFRAVGTTATIAIALLLMAWWLVKGPIANVLNSMADKNRAEGNATIASHAAHVEVLSKLASALDATHASIVSTVAADGDRTRAVLATVGEGVDGVVTAVAALPRTCPVPGDQRPAGCPITPPKPFVIPATPEKASP